MNQILVTEKLYVTPSVKRKKKVYKIEFFLSIFLIFVFSTYAIYAEYDRNKSEEVSQEILGEIDIEALREASIEKIIEDEIIVYFNEKNKKITKNEIEIIQEKEIPDAIESVASDGTRYYTIGTINIPEIKVNYPILSPAEANDIVEDIIKLMKVSPVKINGANPNRVGNLCIIGHNYLNSKFFSKVPKLETGDIIEITDLSGKTVTYKVYNKYIVTPEDTSVLYQNVEGKREITLITCTDNGKERVVIKAAE